MERSPATSAGTEQVAQPGDDAELKNAGPTAAESPTPGDEGAGGTTTAPPVPSTTDASSELDKRVALLTEEPAAPEPETAPKKQPVVPPATDAAKDEEKGKPNAAEAEELPELPEDERKRNPKAAKAFAELRTMASELRTQVRTQAEQAAADAPVAEFGRSLLESIGPAFQDLQGLEDAEIREAIQERAAIKRGERPKPTGLPPELMGKLETALAAAEESLDFTEVRKLLGEAKGTAPAATPKPATPPAAGDRGQPAQPQASSAPNREAIQVLRTRNALIADGIEPQGLDTYVRGRLLPKVLSDLKAAFPRQDPGTVFNDMDPADRHQLLLDVHRLVMVQKKPPAQPTKPPATRPRTPLTNGTAGRTPAAGGAPVSTNLAERVSYLTEG